MIRLNRIDHQRLLQGARLPLVRRPPEDPALSAWWDRLSPTWKEKVLAENMEWRLDAGWSFYQNNDDEDVAERVELDLDVTCLDPAEEETGRWLDRKIAEAVIKVPIRAADLIVKQSPVTRRWHFGLAWLTETSSETGSIVDGPLAAVLDGLEVTLANVPEARERLVYHLFPAVPLTSEVPPVSGATLTSGAAEP